MWRIRWCDWCVPWLKWPDWNHSKLHRLSSSVETNGNAWQIRSLQGLISSILTWNMDRYGTYG
jgi:hypothetical protein